MNSSEASAASSRPLFGVDSTGLPAIVTKRAPGPPRGLDLVGQGGHGELAEDLRRPRTRDLQRPDV